MNAPLLKRATWVGSAAKTSPELSMATKVAVKLVVPTVEITPLAATLRIRLL